VARPGPRRPPRKVPRTRGASVQISKKPVNVKISRTAVGGNRLPLVGLAVVVATLLAPTGALAGVHPAPAAHPSVPAVGSTPTASSVLGSSAAKVQALETSLRDRGVPLRDIHLPDLMAESTARKGPVAPTYATGPAPMGVSDLGVKNVSGTLVPYDYNTSSVVGSLSLNRSEAVYVDGDGPDTFGVQLNAVATGVTLLGVPGISSGPRTSSATRPARRRSRSGTTSGTSPPRSPACRRTSSRRTVRTARWW